MNRLQHRHNQIRETLNELHLILALMDQALQLLDPAGTEHWRAFNLSNVPTAGQKFPSKKPHPCIREPR